MDAALVWPPTVARHVKPAPTPGWVVHCTSVPATVTEHTALSVRDADVLVYAALTDDAWGPRLVPTRVTRVPPAVVNGAAGDLPQGDRASKQNP